MRLFFPVFFMNSTVVRTQSAGDVVDNVKNAIIGDSEAWDVKEDKRIFGGHVFEAIKGNPDRTEKVRAVAQRHNNGTHQEFYKSLTNIQQSQSIE